MAAGRSTLRERSMALLSPFAFGRGSFKAEERRRETRTAVRETRNRGRKPGTTGRKVSASSGAVARDKGEVIPSTPTASALRRGGARSMEIVLKARRKAPQPIPCRERI